MIKFRYKFFANLQAQAANMQKTQMAMQRSQMVQQGNAQTQQMIQQRQMMNMQKMQQKNAIDKQKMSLRERELLAKRDRETDKAVANTMTAEKKHRTEHLKSVGLYKGPSGPTPPVPME